MHSLLIGQWLCPEGRLGHPTVGFSLSLMVLLPKRPHHIAGNSLPKEGCREHSPYPIMGQ